MSIVSRCAPIAGTVVVSIFLAGCAPQAITPHASMFIGESGGCGDFSVYRFNDDRTLAITVQVNEKALPLVPDPTPLDVVANGKNVGVEILQFRAPAGDYFCDDVGGDPPPVANWAAVSGTVVVESRRGVAPKEVSNATHVVSLVLKDVRLKNSKTGEIVELDAMAIPSVWVGWYPG